MKAGSDVCARLFDLQFKRLAFAAHRERTLVALFGRFESFAAQGRGSRAFEPFEYAFKFYVDAGLDFEHHCAALILDHVGSEHADRRQSAGGSWGNDLGDAQRLRQGDGMQSAGATKRQQRELAAIMTTFD